MQKVLGGLNTLGRRQSLSASKKIKTPPTAMASSTSAPQLSEKMSNAVTGVATMKRIIVCCDGTWQDNTESTMISPTNITLMSRAILPVTPKDSKKPGVEQIVYYQAGVGTSYGTLERVRAGAVGEGLMEHVREVYGFIAHNYAEGDEIYLFGFSRGAYTARSVSGLISLFGLLTKRGMDGIAYVLDAYRRNELINKAIIDQLGGKYERGFVNVPIKVVGVFDTVGSLGIPDIYIGGWKVPGVDEILSLVDKNYQFADTNLHPNVEHAFQALALNEARGPFTPTIWKLGSDNKSTFLKQCWFSGAHQSIGGGDPSHGLSDITLAWMMQQITDHTELEINVKYLLDSRKTFSPHQLDLPWGTEPWKDTYTGIYVLMGNIPRTPGKYPVNPGETTNEFVHKSVLQRIKLEGTAFKHPDVSQLKEDEFGALEQELMWE